MTRHARRTDANHARIRDELRGKGYDVCDLSGCGDGIPDLMVRLEPGLSHFLEIKDGDKPLSAQKLTMKQEVWRKFMWQMTTTVRNTHEAILAIECARPD